ncbi:hypothetical protein [Mesorhizobium sp. WSM3859]|uniref:hypothetical protein n=1 Tax=Mesorhizobium sp. WSM3859 TaxID=2029402 RepID=UPI000BAF2E4B|nr:hypothetical protein [Mesorhizobium sp. WSM3859]PBC07201.1 hypothetical protein CK230_27860 [Mesorhizobium sp. WSM3859]
MKKDGHDSEADKRLLAEKLARDVGITEEQASELINMIGTDWPSLVREARFLKDRH